MWHFMYRIDLAESHLRLTTTQLPLGSCLRFTHLSFGHCEPL